LTEYVPPDKNALVVPVKDVEAAVQSVDSLLDDRERCRRMAEEGYTTVTDCADSDAANDFLNVVEQYHSARNVPGP
jgi:hypothetical protein